ncbi:MAG: tRNA (adenosine(37)-N6)-threonylcarbamoyltransferase complex dimerization subunit type 1 TsaB [Candidatus Omnitrophota bacterium]
MRLLAFDTSTSNFSLALFSDGEIAEESTLLGNLLSERIIPSIESFFKEQQTALQQLDGLAIGLGPGSFTGLRIGLATAKGLAMALNKPLVGISSLDVLAMAAQGAANKICCMMDAKRDNVYAATYSFSGGKLRRTSPYLLTELDSLLKTLSGDYTFIGDKRGIRDFPRAGNLARLAQLRFACGKFNDVSKLVPIYLYPKECQIRLRK